jgi:hypothetical protein
LLRGIFTRRAFLALAGAFALLGLPLGRWLRERDSSHALHTHLRPQLRACLDSLLPRDDLGPSATDLDVDSELLGALAAWPVARAKLYVQGLDWCDKQARTRFSRTFSLLDESDRDAILRLAANSPERSMPSRFLYQLRHDAFAVYYAHPDVVRHIHGAGPPQPAGYADYAEPPA